MGRNSLGENGGYEMAIPMLDHMVVEMESLMDIHWERSHLMHMVEMG